MRERSGGGLGWTGPRVVGESVSLSFLLFIFFSLLRLFSGFLVSFWFVVHVFWFNNDWCGLPASARLRLFVPAAFDFQG